MKKKIIIITLLIIYVVVLVIIGLSVLSKVKLNLVEYESSQPEYVVENQIKIIQKAARENRLGEVMLPPEGREDFDWNSELNESYVKLIADGKLEYSLSNTDFYEDGQVYNIIADGTIVAKMKLQSSNMRTRLIVFNMYDWKCEFTRALISVYDVSLSLPEELIAYANGEKITGTPGEEGMIDYSVSSTSPIKMSVSDIYGNKLDIDENTTVETQSYIFNLPSNFTLSVAGQVISKDGLEITKNELYQYVEEYYPDMPGFVTYDVSCLITDGTKDKFEIRNNLGEKVDFLWDKTTVTLTEQATLDKVPDSILSEIDLMKFAESYRYYMSADLGSSSKKYGFDKISAYFIKDSFFYNIAYHWMDNIDITFISNHVNLDPPFRDEVMDNFISFGDRCFSVHLSLFQRMRLKDGQYKDEPFDEYCFFVKYDTTDDGKDNPSWYLVDMYQVFDDEIEE